MGSAQSNPEHDNNNKPSVQSTVKSINDYTNEAMQSNTDAGTTTTKSTRVECNDPNRPSGGMPLVHYVCRKKKRAYDKCVSNWYSTDFLSGTGSSLNQEDVCGNKFELYRTCILKGIKKEIWDKQNLPPPKHGSPLAEVIDDDTENNQDKN